MTIYQKVELVLRELIAANYKTNAIEIISTEREMEDLIEACGGFVELEIVSFRPAKIHAQNEAGTRLVYTLKVFPIWRV